jgi:hypothetical protein
MIALVAAGVIAFGAIAPTMNDSGPCGHPHLVKPKKADSTAVLEFVGFPLGSRWFWRDHFVLHVTRSRGDSATFTMSVGEAPGTEYMVTRRAGKHTTWCDATGCRDTLLYGCPSSRLVKVR